VSFFRVVFGFILVGLLGASNVWAHPVSYQGATAIMAWNQPWLSDYWIAYSFRPDMAIAARSMKMDMPEGRLWVALPQYDVLLKRWNQKDSQANIYAYAGGGGAWMNGRTGNA
jgi:hypothetical protein